MFYWADAFRKPTRGSRKKKFLFNGRAIKALKPLPLEFNGRRNLFSLIASPLPPSLNGMIIKKEDFSCFPREDIRMVSFFK